MWWKVAALSGALGVAMGAFGAHGLQDALEGTDLLDIWSTASRYHLVHALALLGVAAHPGSAKWSGWLFVVGTVLFCGSLYSMVLLYVLTGHKYGVLGAITPFGGISFIVAGLSLGWTTTRRVGRS